MPTNAREFVAALRHHREEEVPKIFAEAHRRAHRILYDELLKPGRVPVATGRFRGSYDTTLDKPSTKVLPSDAPFYPVQGADHVDRVLEGLKPFGRSFITNNASSDGGKTSYAEALDNGHSPQAKEIVRPAIRSTVVRLKRSR